MRLAEETANVMADERQDATEATRAPEAAAARPHGAPVLLRLYHGFGRVGGPPLGRWLLQRRAARGKEDPARVQERLGHPSLARPAGRLLWLHAASVGESQSLLPLVAARRAARPEETVLVTTGTRTSAALMAARLPDGALHQYAPIDTVEAMRRFLAHWRPDAFGLVESELWPTMLKETKGVGAPMALLSARLSERSTRRWARAPRAAAALLAYFDVILAQDHAVMTRLRRLGADPARLSAPGALKQAAAPLPVDAAALSALRALCSERPLWLAASTHEGEEAAAIAAHQRLKARWPALLTVIAPRHPERGAAVADAAAAAGLSATRRALGETIAPGADLYIADTLGEMGLWYSLAPIVFLGGSLVPMGGHNPREAAQFGAALAMGPHRENARGECARLEAVGALALVASADALADAVTPFFDAEGRPSAEALRSGGAARRAVADDEGVLARYVKALETLMSR
ncbi:MAG: glycosyltransferase N-terminal domain-containing protein [Pseudomonadota bacterium]